MPAGVMSITEAAVCTDRCPVRLTVQNIFGTASHRIDPSGTIGVGQGAGGTVGVIVEIKLLRSGGTDSVTDGTDDCDDRFHLLVFLSFSGLALDQKIRERV